MPIRLICRFFDIFFAIDDATILRHATLFIFLLILMPFADRYYALFSIFIMLRALMNFTLAAFTLYYAMMLLFYAYDASLTIRAALPPVAMPSLRRHAALMMPLLRFQRLIRLAISITRCLRHYALPPSWLSPRRFDAAFFATISSSAIIISPHLMRYAYLLRHDAIYYLRHAIR